MSTTATTTSPSIRCSGKSRWLGGTAGMRSVVERGGRIDSSDCSRTGPRPEDSAPVVAAEAVEAVSAYGAGSIKPKPMSTTPVQR